MKYGDPERKIEVSADWTDTERLKVVGLILYDLGFVTDLNEKNLLLLLASNLADSAVEKADLEESRIRYKDYIK